MFSEVEFFFQLIFVPTGRFVWQTAKQTNHSTRISEAQVGMFSKVSFYVLFTQSEKLFWLLSLIFLWFMSFIMKFENVIRTSVKENDSRLFTGNLQGTFILESIMEHIASYLQKDTTEEIKEMNFYKNGQVWFIIIPKNFSHFSFIPNFHIFLVFSQA